MCQHKDTPYQVITSTKGFTYRIEVLQEKQLVDAIEVSCEFLATSPEAESKFYTTYTAAHKEMKHRYCPDLDISSSQFPHSSLQEKPLRTISTVSPASLVDKKTTKTSWDSGSRPLQRLQNFIAYDKLSLLFLLIGMFTIFLFSGYLFLCNDSAAAWLFPKEKERIAYYEQTESLCHRLEKGCIALAKDTIEQIDVFTSEHCHQWCNRSIINEETCSLILPYFQVNEKHLSPVDRNKSAKDTALIAKPLKSYAVIPKGIFYISYPSVTELKFQNFTDKTMWVILKRITLDQNNFEEIVQLQNSEIIQKISGDQNGTFPFFLESTYYRAFEKRTYTGILEFEVMLSADKNETLKTVFSFEVK